jgi:hypothetical protein
MFFFIFFHVKRKRSKRKRPVPRLILRVGVPAGARGNSLALKQSARFFPSDPPMLGADQRGNTKSKVLELI